MPRLTDEQLLAVNKSATNIIVSAGAGSGKTTVLKERVLRELKDGVSVNNLIILTFTNNAAREMRERIRKIINSNPEVSAQKTLVDTAYITTFDSFAQSLVKKYNYLLNISKHFSIVDASLIAMKKEEFLDEIFERLYTNDQSFKNLINHFCIKDDRRVRDAILLLFNSLANCLDKKQLLESYIEKYYSDEFIKQTFLEYEALAFSLRDDIVTLLDELDEETIDADKREINSVNTNNFRYATTYDELLDAKKIELARATKNVYTDEGKEIKEKISKKLKDLEKYLSKSKKMLISDYLSTKEFIETIIKILNDLDEKINDYKNKNSLYEFQDIALKAIELVEKFPQVREEIKNSTFEIMIDEYQDTNDIQEKFISYIANNNVYMVGDIKQSIYRFRNANPYIFKEKYDAYKNGKNGFKIDLNMNFRSRNEVIENINTLFNLIMHDDIGGADYQREHMMSFGNKEYTLNSAKDQNYDLEIWNYSNENKHYSNVEIEAFMIARDIKDKISRHYQVSYFQDNKMMLRDATYSDFVILVDKSKQFDTIKKILEFHGIPVMIDKDISIQNDDEIYIIKNLLSLIIHIKEQKFDTEFRHAFVSVARSYICNIDDEAITELVFNSNYKNTDLFQKCLMISKNLDALSNRQILELIYDTFEITNKIITVGDIEERLTKLEYLINNADSLNSYGMDIYSMNNYLSELILNKSEIKMSIKSTDSNAIKIMTIHKSKGLEFNIAYLPLLGSDFTRAETNSLFKFSSKYGILVPSATDEGDKSYLSRLDKISERKEELSERIRLLYVALTRAKEKLIMITQFNDAIEPIINSNDVSKLIGVKSYSDIISLIKPAINKYIITKNIDELGITQDYNSIKNFNYKNAIANKGGVISVDKLSIDNQIIEKKTFSKSLNERIDLAKAKVLERGTYLHKVFEVTNFKELLNRDCQNNDEVFVKNFLNHNELKQILDAKIFKEHDIRFLKDGALYHGVIDLLLEYEDHFDIFDYKTSNTESPEYILQLQGYKDFIENKYHKKTYIYLYSILNDTIEKID